MLLRRFMKHLTEQNWLAVTLDICVVIIGIILGLQFTDWNEGRKERQDERIYLERILNDLNSSIEFQKNDLEFIDKNIKAFDFVIERIAAKELSDEQNEPFAHGLSMAFRVNPIQFVRTAFKELQSSGKITLIQNIKLRDALGTLDARYDYRVRQIEYPNASLNYSKNKLSEYYHADWNESIYDWERLVGDQSFMFYALKSQQSYKTIRFFHQQFHERTLHVRVQLNEYLANKY